MGYRENGVLDVKRSDHLKLMKHTNVAHKADYKEGISRA